MGQTVENLGNWYGFSYGIRFRHTQPRPYLKPLPYEFRFATSNGPRLYLDQPYAAIPLVNGTVYDGLGGVVTASNKALTKLYDRLGQSEALLVAWKERQSAVGLVTSSLRRLVTIARAVKRRDPKVIRRVLKRNPDAKDIIKQPSGLWLEYHFAIVPTIMDLHHAFGVLGFEFPVEKLEASSKVTHRREEWPGGYGWWVSEGFTSVVKLTGEIYGLNPNVILASQLGFGQPLSVAWEMTPFSWFVDYFVNVGDLLKNFEPRFPGVLTRNHCTTTLVKCKGKRGYHSPGYPVEWLTYDSVRMNRTLSWPNFQLETSGLDSLSVQKCSYIAAVLTQILTSFSKKS